MPSFLKAGRIGPAQPSMQVRLGWRPVMLRLNPTASGATPSPLPLVIVTQSGGQELRLGRRKGAGKAG